MRLVTAAHLDAPPGRLSTCTVTPTAPPEHVVDAPPSFNQINHATSQAATGGWLCLTLELAGPPDATAMSSAVQGLLRRHEVLRTSVDLSGGEPRTLRYGDEFTCAVEDFELPEAATERHAMLLSALDTGTHATGAPHLACAVVATSGRELFVLAVDHGVADAVSIPLLARDFVQLYDGARTGRAADLPAVGSFLDACREAALDTTDPDDPRIGQWHEYFDRHSGGLPRFPLPEAARHHDGVAAVELRHTLTGSQTQTVAEWGRTRGARLSACLLAAGARALHVCGLGTQLSTLIPVGTRTRAEWHEAVGWFVSNGPVTVPGDVPLEDAVRVAQQQVSRAQQLAAMHLGDVISSYQPGFAHTGDVGMISYLDYRHVAGRELHRTVSLTQASPDAPTTDVQLWWVRDDDGLSLRCRLPGTSSARRIVLQWLDEIERVLRTVGG